MMDLLLFISQLPATPSSLRVAVWRKMRAAGALGLQNGVWVLPVTPEHEQFLEELLISIHNQGASGQIFKVNPLYEIVEEDILNRFRVERDEEYAEFCDRCQEFLDEMIKETDKKKFTFAELEELEQDRQRLENWLEKIRKRDFAGGKRMQEASMLLEKGREGLKEFSHQVYTRQGLENPMDMESFPFDGEEVK